MLQPDQLTDAELAAIEARAEASTPEPWEITTSIDVFSAVIAPGRATICMDCEKDTDAEFIAAARQDVPRLCAEVRRRQRQAEDDDRSLGRTIDERDFREEQINKIYAALDGENEWSNLHDLGDESLELIGGLQSEVRTLHQRVAALENRSTDFVCPECGGTHFSRPFVRTDHDIVEFGDFCCADEFGKGCKWRGPWSAGEPKP